MAGYEDVLAAQGRLRDAGIVVDFLGGVRLSTQAQERYNLTPWARDFPIREGTLQASPLSELVKAGAWMPGKVPRRLIGRIVRHIDALDAVKMWLEPETTDPVRQDYLRQVRLSSGGPLAGHLWTEVPNNPNEFFASALGSPLEHRVV